MAKACECDQKTTLSEGGRPNCNEHGVGKGARLGPDHSKLTKHGNENDDNEDERWSDLRSEEGHDAAHNEGAEDLVHSEGFFDFLFLFVVVQAEEFSVLVVHARSADHKHCNDAHVPKVNPLSSLTEFNILAFV